MAEFYGYFSLVDNRGIDFLAILYRRENLSLAARKFNRVPSYVSNVLTISSKTGVYKHHQSYRKNI
jgi:hypothetical protein